MPVSCSLMTPLRTPWGCSIAIAVPAVENGSEKTVCAVQVSTGFSSHMSFAQRVQNVITYAVVGLIDWLAFHRCSTPPCPVLKVTLDGRWPFHHASTCLHLQLQPAIAACPIRISILWEP